MLDLVQPFVALPAHGLAAVVLVLLYAIQSEVRFGRAARTHAAGAADRGSSLAVAVSSAVPIVGLVLTMKSITVRGFLPLPGMPMAAWLGVGLGALGLLIRLWSVLTLRDRYTRTLRTERDQMLEGGGPYRYVRHPGYLGSLFCLNGIAIASGSLPTAIVSLAATMAAYAYRIRVEEAMLVARFGTAYETYQREVAALWPFKRTSA